MAVGRRNAIATDRSRADQGELGTFATCDRRTDPLQLLPTAAEPIRVDSEQSLPNSEPVAPPEQGWSRSPATRAAVPEEEVPVIQAWEASARNN